MIIRFRFLLTLGLLTCLLTPGQSQSTHTVAKTNEMVWVVAYSVKPNKRAQYERFVHEIFWGGAKKLPAADQKVLKQTRIMHPTKAEADGSYAYLFIMDPVIKGADYDIESLLKKMYGAKQGTEYFKLFTTATNKGYKMYEVVQSKD